MQQNSIIRSLFAVIFAACFFLPSEATAATIESIREELANIEQDKVYLKTLANSLVEEIESSNNPDQDIDELKNIQERIRILNARIETLKMARAEIEIAEEAATIAATQASQQAAESQVSSSDNRNALEKDGFPFWKVGGAILVVIIIIAGIISNRLDGSSGRSHTTVIQTENTTEVERQHQPFLPQNGGNVQTRPQSGNSTSSRNHNRPTVGRPGIDNPRDNGVIPEDIV